METTDRETRVQAGQEAGRRFVRAWQSWGESFTALRENAEEFAFDIALGNPDDIDAVDVLEGMLAEVMAVEKGELTWSRS